MFFLSYQECFLCLIEFCNLSFLNAIFLQDLTVEIVSLGDVTGGKFLGISALPADVNFSKKKSRFLDVVLLLNIVCMILIALMMFNQQ